MESRSSLLLTSVEQVQGGKTLSRDPWETLRGVMENADSVRASEEPGGVVCY
jgi:hypothetical protein